MRRVFAFAILLTLAAAPLPSFAQEEKPAEKPAQEKQLTDEEKEIKKYEEKIKDLPKFEGDFTIYQRKQELLIELPEDKLDKLFCLQATVKRGIGSDGLQAGDPINQEHLDVFRFRKGPQGDIQLVKPNLGYRFDPADPLGIASGRAFTDAIIDNYSIEATHPVKHLILINATELFQGEVVGLKQAISATVGAGYSPDKQNYSVERVASFPENSVVEYNVHYKSTGIGGDEGLQALLAALLGSSGPPLADKRSLPLTVSTNIWFRRDHGYQPRLADPRVGYFTSDYFDVEKFNGTDRTTRLIQRFHLEKKDPKAAVSEPVKPIVWILDPSIPLEYRSGVRDGILYWNKAFEAIGFKNAIQVQDAPKDANYDHADGRYNLVRWIMSESSAYAVAWFRPDPITGEIMNAAVTVDANYPASAFTEFKEEVAGRTMRQPWIDEDGRQTLLRQFIDKPMAKNGFRRIGCDHASGLAEQAAYGYALMEAKGIPVDAHEYVRIMVADLVAHEVGHCLGLRHNFAASTYKSQSELADYDSIAKTGVAASVMDYVGLNTQAVLAGHKGYYNPTIGPYDLWAIQYGYSPLGVATKQEPYFLNQIANRYGEPGLLYLTDEDADGMNPLSVRWDLGSDILEFLKVQKEGDALLRRYAINSATQPGESYSRRNSLILRTIRAGFRDAAMAARMVGGFEFRRNLKGDLDEKPTLIPVAPARQVEAMRTICSNALAMTSLDLPQDVLFSFSQDPNAGGADYNAPLRDYVARQQMITAAMLLAPDKLDAIAENDFKTLGNRPRYTLSQHFDILCQSVFAKVFASTNVPALQRDLQRYVLANLASLANAKPGSVNTDANLIAGDWLERLKVQVAKAQQNPNLDPITVLHLKQMAKEIKEATETKSGKTS